MISEEVMKRLEALEGADRLAVGKALTDLKEGFKKLFNTVLEKDLTHDEMLEIAKTQLDLVYAEFMRGGETFER